MKQYEDLSLEDKLELHSNAFAFVENHPNHVNELLENKVHGIAPSGSDMFHPELWKDIHWTWYFETQRVGCE